MSGVLVLFVFFDMKFGWDFIGSKFIVFLNFVYWVLCRMFFDGCGFCVFIFCNLLDFDVGFEGRIIGGGIVVVIKLFFDGVFLEVVLGFSFVFFWSDIVVLKCVVEFFWSEGEGIFWIELSLDVFLFLIGEGGIFGVIFNWDIILFLIVGGILGLKLCLENLFFLRGDEGMFGVEFSLVILLFLRGEKGILGI